MFRPHPTWGCQIPELGRFGPENPELSHWRGEMSMILSGAGYGRTIVGQIHAVLKNCFFGACPPEVRPKLSCWFIKACDIHEVTAPDTISEQLRLCRHKIRAPWLNCSFLRRILDLHWGRILKGEGLCEVLRYLEKVYEKTRIVGV